MPLFSSTSSSSTRTPQPSADGSFTAPTRHDRAQCWAARDAFFACLDAHGIIDSVTDSAGAETSCGKLDAALRRDCAQSWVGYFKQRRVMEHKKKAMLEGLAKEGAVEMPGVAAAATAAAARKGQGG